MSVHINEDKGIITFSNKIAYVCDVFEFKKPVTYSTKNTVLEDGTPIMVGYLDDDIQALESNVLPVIVYGDSFNELITNTYKEIIHNYFYNDKTINDPIVKYCM